jgi:hypothetical protein
LEYLDIRDCDIKDFALLSQIKTLKTLRISVKDNSDLLSLQTLNQIEELHLVPGPQVSAELLSGMTGLRKIVVYNASDLQFEAIRKNFSGQAVSKLLHSNEAEAIEVED